MKILMVDKYYFVKGGVERYMFEFADALRRDGHEVIFFSMKDERNEETPYEKFFVDHIDFEFKSPLEKLSKSLKVAGRVIYSRHAQKKLKALIEETKPDIAHLHMIDHQISPSILPVLKHYQIPVIQTAHQYKLVCPNYLLYIPQKEQVCEACMDRHYFHAFFNKCHKNSYGASALVALESTIHKWLGIYKHVQLFHVPSRFMGEKLKQGGVPAEKIRHQVLSINLADYPFYSDFDDYCVYLGRVSYEKGISTLLKAVHTLSGSGINLKIVGDGPIRGDLEKESAQLNLNNVAFLGQKSGTELKEIIGKARFVIIPSEWYENCPLVVLESFALGKPVVGARIGGISELIDDGINGRLFRSGSVDELARCIGDLYHDEDWIRKLGAEARKKAETHFSWDANYQKTIRMYKELLQQDE